MIVDASVWISAFIREDVFHRRSRTWLAQHSESGLAVPSLAFVEVAGAIARIQDNAERGRRVSRWLRVSSAIEVLDIHGPLMVQAAEIAATYRRRGADAVYVAVAQDLNLPLVTWDAELHERAAPIIEVIQP